MSEKLYDEVIAPKLAELGKLCEENGMSLVAHCQFSPDGTGRTACLVKGSGFAIRLTDAAARCAGNVDTLFIALCRYAEEHGHNSFVLERLGVKARNGESSPNR